jgi:hypothetical protein
MKLSAFLISCFIAGTFFFSSCNNDDKKSSDTTTNDTTSVNNNQNTEQVNTIVTTPQNMMVVKHRVKDFNAWKASYDAHDSMRLKYGIHSYVVGRSADDSNMVLVAVKLDDLEKAKAFSKDPSLKQAMQKGGVVGTPTITFTTMVWQDTAKITTDLRSRTTFTVKDFAAWQQAFQQHKQERMDNGVVDRAFGHDVDNDKNVTLVVAVTDTAKAQAYWKSDLLKQRRTESGVTSQPDRFIYRVVQRY